MNLVVNERLFYIWKLELWWVAFDLLQYRPGNRRRLIGNWYWRI